MKGALQSLCRYVGTSHRVVPPEETLRRFSLKLSVAGVTRIADITGLDRVGIPVFSAMRPSARQGAVSVHSGKGTTAVEAKVSAMMESFERYSAEMHSEDLVRGSFYELEGEGAIDPNSLILPAKIDARSLVLEWIAAKNLFDGEEYLVPANAVFHPYNPSDARAMHIFRSNTNGLASGNTLEEAILHGLLEVIERDAWSLAEASRKTTGIACDSVPERLAALVERFERANIKIHLHDITSDIGIPTVAAVADDVELCDAAFLTFGVGTHLDPSVAVARALTEVAQNRVVQIQGAREDIAAQVKAMRSIGYERMKEINKHWFFPDAMKSFEAIEDISAKDISEDIQITLEALRRRNFKLALFVELTREELGVPVVRVIVPGLEQFSVDASRKGKRFFKALRERQRR